MTKTRHQIYYLLIKKIFKDYDLDKNLNPIQKIKFKNLNTL